MGISTTYRRNRAGIHEDLIDANPVLSGLREMIMETKLFQGTARTLLDKLNEAVVGLKGPRWPQSEEQLARCLRRNVALLPELEFTFNHRTGKCRDRMMVIRWRGAGDDGEDHKSVIPEQGPAVQTSRTPKRATKSPDSQSSLFA